MGDFYGYDPSRFVVPDRYGIGAASQAASQTVMNVSQAVSQKKAAEAKEKEKQEKIRLAAEAIAKDKTAVRSAYDSVIKNHRKTITSLVNEGALTQDEAEQKISALYSLEPTDIALKDPMKYITMLNDANMSFMSDLSNVKKEFKTQRDQGRVTRAVTQAMRGTPATPGSPATPDQTVVNQETIPAGVGRGALRPPMNAWGDAETTTILGKPAVEPKPAIPPSQNQQEAVLRAQEILEEQGYPQATQSQFKAGNIDYQIDFTKEELNKEKVDIQKLRLAYSKEKDSNLNWYREEMMKLANAKDEFTRSKHRDNLDAYADDLAEKIFIAKNKQSQLENQKDPLGNPIPIDPKQMVAWDSYIKEMEDAQKETVTNKKLKTIRQNVTTVPTNPPNIMPSEYSTMKRERPTGTKKKQVGKYEVEFE